MKEKLSIFKHPYYLTDGGLETTLIFHKGISLNCLQLLNFCETKKEKKFWKNTTCPTCI